MLSAFPTFPYTEIQVENTTGNLILIFCALKASN